MTTALWLVMRYRPTRGSTIVGDADGHTQTVALETSTAGKDRYMPMTQPPADLRGNLCHIAPEREAGRGQKVWFVSAPYGGDVLRFRGEPTSLLYAIAPLVERIRRPGRDSSSALAKLDYHADLAFLNPTTTSEALYAEIEARLRQQDLKLLCISVMTASSQEGRRIAALAKKVNPSTVVVFGGPHENQSRSYATAIDPEFRQIVDFSIRGDGEESLLRLAEIVLSQDSAGSALFISSMLTKRNAFRSRTNRSISTPCRPCPGSCCAKRTPARSGSSSAKGGPSRPRRS